MYAERVRDERIALVPAVEAGLLPEEAGGDADPDVLGGRVASGALHRLGGGQVRPASSAATRAT